MSAAAISTAATRDREAKEILAANDRGNYSVPTKGLYPFQWNWDSAFAALGYAHIDPERAVRELEALATSQWPDGMIAHIIFHQADEGYFPGPDVWATNRAPPTSGITQPPVLAIAASRLAERGILAGDRLAGICDAAARWHAWFADARGDPETGAIAVVHPWESGRDNMPDWDAALEDVDASNVKPFVRRDLGHVDAAMRPTEAQYKRFIALVELGVGVAWDQKRYRDVSPFLVADPGMTAILFRAEKALAKLSTSIGRDDLAEAANSRAERLAAGFSALWNDAAGGPTTRNVRTGDRGKYLSSMAFLGFSPGLLSADKIASLTKSFDAISDRCRFMVPSYDPAAETFDEKRYWRGPVWLVVNWLIADGLREAGDTARADAIRTASAELVERGGFYEYYSALDGAPLGGPAFSWSAAAWLDFVRGTDG
ncbi:MAG: hypothetical protein AAGB11_00370 [Pseudomonadota bacterium]